MPLKNTLFFTFLAGLFAMGISACASAPPGEQQTAVEPVVLELPAPPTLVWSFCDDEIRKHGGKVHLFADFVRPRDVSDARCFFNEERRHDYYLLQLPGQWSLPPLSAMQNDLRLYLANAELQEHFTLTEGEPVGLVKDGKQHLTRTPYYVTVRRSVVSHKVAAYVAVNVVQERENVLWILVVGGKPLTPEVAREAFQEILDSPPRYIPPPATTASS